MLGHGKYGESEVNDAIGRFKTIAYGGTALDDGQAEQMLTSAGLVEVRIVPSPLGTRQVPSAANPRQRDATN